jgi:uncharacterized membrane protein YfcA
MSDWSIAVVALATLGTSFLSGIFGMVGGAILIGVLLMVLPVPAAMTLHAVAQMTANGQRAVLWHSQIIWKALLGYLLGAGIMFALLALVQFSPPKPWIYLCLGILPFAALLVPKGHTPDIRRKGAPLTAGLLVMAMMVLAGVPGVMLDMFFQSRDLNRRVIIATKAAMQTAGNIAKSAYFAFIVAAQAGPGGFSKSLDLSIWVIAMTAAMAVFGTLLAKPVLHRFSDRTFHHWSQRLILAVGAVYLVKGITGLVW